MPKVQTRQATADIVARCIEYCALVCWLHPVLGAKIYVSLNETREPNHEQTSLCDPARRNARI